MRPRMCGTRANQPIWINAAQRHHGQLGEDAKKRDVLERALAIQEREYGSDHIRKRIVAVLE